jgi:hypothetical protein
VASAPNDPPVLLSAPRERVRVGDEYFYWLRASDPNGDALTYWVVQGPAGMAIDAQG